LLTKNEDLKNGFAVLLSKFEDYVSSSDLSQDQMRSTIKRLSIENQRMKVNH